MSLHQLEDISPASESWWIYAAKREANVRCWIRRVLRGWGQKQDWEYESWVKLLDHLSDPTKLAALNADPFPTDRVVADKILRVFASRAANDVRSRAGRKNKRIRDQCSRELDKANPIANGVSSGADPCEIAGCNELHRIVLDSLSPAELQLFELVHPQSAVPQAEVASILGVSPRTVRLRKSQLEVKLWNLVSELSGER